MRRILLLVIGMLALAIAVPSAASAHGRHHHRHHHHKHKAKHARTAHFGGDASSNVDPSGPAGPGDAGTVASFDGTVLTITLADGSTVSGEVTGDTNVNCLPAVQQPNTIASHDSGSGDDQSGDDQSGDDQSGDDQSEDGGGQPACDATDLVPGAVVHEAILKLGANGARFKLVLLVDQPATS